MANRILFADRAEAGGKLAERLTPWLGQDCVVLALPRGGVPVALPVARMLGAPLDLLFVRKIGAPGFPEFAIGAVVDGADPQVVLNEGMSHRIPQGYLETEVPRLLAEIDRRRKAYRGDRPPVPVAGRTAIVVDDGVATGATMLAGLQGLARQNPARIIVAVPVGARDALDRLRGIADQILCLECPHPFRAVGLHYRDFDQVGDAEVIAALAG
ncbi:phosphoribosyltransferase [Paracoccus sp. SSK6]|uniref:phosphoribosyltransferase n=1 Tax=Paracoccus sp. SSK6 TaxID=3143131 RepID=UPI00321B443D